MQSLQGSLLKCFIPDVSPSPPQLPFSARLAKLRHTCRLLYLSYFYKNSELPVRLAYFWTSLITTHIIASSLAYGILHLRWQNGLAGWRWLFAIEGGVTALIGILSRLVNI